MSSLESILADVFKAEGLADYKGAAARAMDDVAKCRWRERIYALRCAGEMNDTEIAEHIGITPRHVKRIVHDHIQIMRSNKSDGTKS